MIYDLGEGPDEVADYVSVPAGQYVCSISEVAPASSSLINFLLMLQRTVIVQNQLN